MKKAEFTTITCDMCGEETNHREFYEITERDCNDFECYTPDDTKQICRECFDKLKFK